MTMSNRFKFSACDSLSFNSGFQSHEGHCHDGSYVDGGFGEPAGGGGGRQWSLSLSVATAAICAYR